MELLAPAQLAWLVLLAPLVLLYVLKRRRTERTVGSTLLWEAALRDLRAERPWKKLIVQLALILQILALVLGALALARPAGAGRVPSGARVAVVIDASASMAARTKAGPTRFDRARSIARAIARGLPPGGEMMIVEAGTQPVVMAPPTRDATELERVLGAMLPRGGGAELEGAAALAAERLRGAPSGSRVVVLTDAAMDEELALDGRTVPVEVRNLGEEVDNTALVALDVRARPEAGAPDRADIFARIARTGTSATDVFVTAQVVGGAVVASRRLRVEPGVTEGVVMTCDLPPDASGRAATVRVELAAHAPGEDGEPLDAFSLDDVAVAPSPGGRKLPVFAIGPVTPSILRVLRADEHVELFATTLTALASRETPEPLDGLQIYAGAVPQAAPPGDSVVIAPDAERVFEATLGARVERPRIVTWDESDGRMRFVTMGDVNLAAARPIRGGRALVSSDAGAVIGSLTRPSGETTIVGFDPAQSDWASRESFVVFFRNVLERARARRAAGGVAAGRIGEPLRIPAPEGTDVVVRAPDGTTLRAASRGGLAVVPTGALPGVYDVEVAGRRSHALRNLLDPNESDLRPRARFTRGGTQVTAAQQVARSEPAEAWPWLAALVLVVLALEAVWATRRNAT